MPYCISLTSSCANSIFSPLIRYSLLSLYVIVINSSSILIIFLPILFCNAHHIIINFFDLSVIIIINMLTIRISLYIITFIFKLAITVKGLPFSILQITNIFPFFTIIPYLIIPITFLLPVKISSFCNNISR